MITGHITRIIYHTSAHYMLVTLYDYHIMSHANPRGNLILFRARCSNIPGHLRCYLSPAARHLQLHKLLTVPYRATRT